MNARYFVTYRNLRARQSDPIEVCIGRFGDENAATRRAKEAYDVPEYGQLLSLRSETDTERRLYSVTRFVIRTLRIVVAAAVALFALAWLPEKSPGIGDVPFAQLTANMLFGSLVRVGMIIGAASLCWVLAFGDGPDE